MIRTGKGIRQNFESKLLNSSQDGAILIILIIAIVTISSIGASMVYLTTSSSYDELITNSQERAYLISESGARYALLKIQNGEVGELDLQTLTFTLSNGDTFVLDVVDNRPDNIMVQSTGTVNEGNWNEGNKMLIYRIKVDKDYSNDLDNWNTILGSAEIADTA